MYYCGVCDEIRIPCKDKQYPQGNYKALCHRCWKQRGKSIPLQYFRVKKDLDVYKRLLRKVKNEIKKKN